MKTLQKFLTGKLLKTVFVNSDLSLLFPEGYEPFAEKNARAKEMFSKAKFPEGFGLR
jgi:hypothetical protein